MSTVPIERPPRSTVTRSATAVTSCSLCEMKMTVRPSAAIERRVTNSALGLLWREHRRRLVEDQDARLSVERLEDLHPLLLADRELPDSRARLDGDPVALAELGYALLDRARVEQERPAEVAMIAEHDVLGHGERLDEPEVLVHHPDPGVERIAR